jgi:flagellar basal body-associated protein FliL
MQKPFLTEPGTRYFLSENLKQCNVKKKEINVILLNVGLLVLFVIIIAVYLIYKKKNKLSEEEKQEKKIALQNYLLTKVYKIVKTDEENRKRMITNLPKFESDYELLHEKFYNI